MHTIAQLRDLIFTNGPMGERLSIQDIYSFVEQNTELDREDFQPAGPNDDSPRWMRNVRNVLQREKEKGSIFWYGDSTYLLLQDKDLIDLEKEFRLDVFNELVRTIGTTGIRADDLRELRIYGGQAGIWRDLARTKLLTEDGKGLAVSFLHSGEHYQDDLTQNHLYYHYPNTDRPGNTDENEIDAARTAALFLLPIFTILPDENNPKLREVKLGYITTQDDARRQFRIDFLSTKPTALNIVGDLGQDEADFVLDDEDAKIVEARSSSRWRRDPTFAINVFKRYGAGCAVCGINILEMLDAAHLKPKSRRGSDDPRNGIVLCASHHRALDAGIIGIQPETLEIVSLLEDVALSDLGITYNDLNHLDQNPHPDALTWLWKSQVRNLN